MNEERKNERRHELGATKATFYPNRVRLRKMQMQTIWDKSDIPVVGYIDQ